MNVCDACMRLCMQCIYRMHARIHHSMYACNVMHAFMQCMYAMYACIGVLYVLHACVYAMHACNACHVINAMYACMSVCMHVM